MKWLHISDLHAGMQDQDWLWPRLKRMLLDDLRKMYENYGPWDLVIFSGDLAQRAIKSDYDKVTEVLEEIWLQFGSMGFAPKLIHTPGNHDIQRLSMLKPEMLVLNRWWEIPEVRSEFFKNPGSDYRKTISEIFSEYTAWSESIKLTPIPQLEVKTGVLPGDSSSIFQHDGKTFGIICLNSTWLQLGGGDYQGKLDVSVRQLLAVTDGDPDRWCHLNDFNILVTHQPTNWLNSISQQYWDSDINPPGRFDVHLFGHMHEPFSQETSIGGAASRASIQAASLCGLQHYKDGIKDRIHGYSLCEVATREGSQRLRVWPRKLYKQAGGSHRFAPDNDFNLIDDVSYVLTEKNDSPGPT